jgi:hydroxymethylbilane synthase
VLAKAGIVRLGHESRITEVLSPEIVLPAVAQGALGVEFVAQRENEFRTIDRLVDKDTMRAVQAERALLAEVQGGCRLPLGAWARIEGDEMVLDACVLSVGGTESVRRRGRKMCSSIRDAKLLGREVASELLGAGADRLLQLAGRSVGQT